MADLATTYRHPRSWTLYILVGGAAFFAVAGALTYLAWSEGAYVPAAIFAGFAFGLRSRSGFSSG